MSCNPYDPETGINLQSGSRIFDVYLNGRNIDTVFYSRRTNVDAEEVRRSLIEHDGYDPGITVRERRGRGMSSRQAVVPGCAR